MPVLFKQRRGLAHSAPRTASSQAFHRSEPTLSRTTSGRLSRPPSAHSNLPALNWQQRYLNPKQWAARLKEFYRKYHIKYLLPLSFVALYMLVGATVFYFVESGADADRATARNSQFNRERALLIKRIEEVARDRAASRAPVRRKFVEEAVDHFHQKLNVDLQTQPTWTFLTAMYFSGTIFTTIGYGDIACSTAWDETESVDNALILNEEEELQPEEQAQPPRMPVLVAIGVTVSWIFICAALFKTWEDWTYAESCYFMFISLSTIGLGDVSVQRRDLMVMCFVFVIIGLSLVSMCINVIQAALEDLYKKLLTKLIIDYQAKLAQGTRSVHEIVRRSNRALGGDHRGASMGMMKMWGSSKTAKYLLPMLSAEKRRAVMEEITEEAKESGLEIPPILEELDKKTGMPKILTMATVKKSDEDAQSKVFQELIRQTDPSRISREPSRSVQPNVIFYDGSSQTEAVIQDDKNDQTMSPELDDLAVQTETVETVFVDECIQTDSTDTTVQEQQTQTLQVETTESESMTAGASYSTSEIQTELVTTAEQELQTYVVSLAYGESQTELVETKNIRIQTPYPEFETVETQTDVAPEELKAPSKISKARRRIQRAFQSRSKTRRKSGPKPEMSDWKDISGSEDQEDEDGAESSHESLDWDPYDGYHAEKQRPVKDLRKMFDKNKQK
ncbi:Protein TWK-8 a [Aphelenchoides avenae]|nr:Protein TWK-8 a [Aphelenchus avenae]